MRPAGIGSGLLALLALGASCKPSKRASSASQPAAPTVIRDAGFATPESVLHDPLYDVYYVSNINGPPGAADDNGFISKVSPQGRVLALKWVDGAADSVTLHAPKGMAVAGDFLFVADLTVLRRFDRQSGAPRGAIEVPGATFLNDVAAGADGAIYFTDSGLRATASGFEPSSTDAVYRLGPEGKLTTLARGDSLGRPNGVAVSNDSVWVVSFGSGELYRIEAGHRVDVRKLPKGSLDGLVLFNGDVYVSSWDGQSIFRGPPTGPFSEIVTGVAAPADIGHDAWRHALLIPQFNDNVVRIVPLAPI